MEIGWHVQIIDVAENQFPGATKATLIGNDTGDGVKGISDKGLAFCEPGEDVIVRLNEHRRVGGRREPCLEVLVPRTLICGVKIGRAGVVVGSSSCVRTRSDNHVL